MTGRYTGPIATLADHRALGVRAVLVACGCGREVEHDAGALPGDLTVIDLRARFRCRDCGGRPVDVRPDWRQFRAAGVGRS